ncbi:MAG: hypothetical protein MUQ56_07315, partial [Thermoleophilia bacterium]|nr:hypothetical protein [Thermoleophilia bacterium]
MSDQNATGDRTAIGDQAATNDHDPRWLTDTYFVSEFNHLDEVRSQFDLPSSVRIHEVTLREAE